MTDPLPSPVAANPDATPGNRRRWYFGIALASLPVWLIVLVLVRASFNAPAPDDYWSTLPFLCDWHDSTSLADHWALLTGQFIGHRLIFTRLVMLADYDLFGSCNLVRLQMVGIAGWLVAVGALLLSVPAVRRSPWLALPVTLLLMHPQGFSNLIFAVGLGNLWVVAFALLAFLSATSEHRGGFGISLGLASVSVMCFANGLLVFPAAVAGLLLRHKYRRAVFCALAGLLVWTLYLHGYHTAAMGPLSLGEVIIKAAIMAGGFASLGNLPVTVSLAVGLIVVVLAGILLCLPRFRRTLPAHAAFLAFCLLTMLMAARGRAGWEDGYMTQDRYRLYGLMILAVGYLAAITFYFPFHKWIGLSAVALAAVYCFFSYATHLAPMWSTRNWFEATALNGQIGVGFPHGVPAGWPPAIAALKRAATADVYHLPTLLDTADLATVEALPAVVRGSVPAFQLQPDGSICGHYLLPTVGEITPKFAVLVSPTRRIILPVALFRAKITELWALHSFIAPRFGLVLPDAVYQSGPQAIYGLYRNAQGRLAVSFVTSQTFP